MLIVPIVIGGVGLLAASLLFFRKKTTPISFGPPTAAANAQAAAVLVQNQEEPDFQSTQFDDFQDPTAVVRSLDTGKAILVESTDSFRSNDSPVIVSDAARQASIDIQKAMNNEPILVRAVVQDKAQQASSDIQAALDDDDSFFAGDRIRGRRPRR